MNINDDIDLKKLFEVIWHGKIKILFISIISFLIGFLFYIQLPNNYSNQIVLSKVDDYELIEYSSLKKRIELMALDSHLKTQASIASLSQRILDQYIKELSDFEEYLFIVNKTSKVQKNLENLPIEDQKKNLFRFVNFLKINEKKKNKDGDIEEYNLIFKWHDPDEALKIIEETLIMTSNNLKNKIRKNLADDLELNKLIKLVTDKETIGYLKEQSAIAKELSIEDNQIEYLNSSPQTSKTNLSLNINTLENSAYYLRGYKAIDREIELIENRKYEHFNLLEQNLEKFENKDLKLIDYNIYTTNTKLTKNMKLTLIISILVGLIVGILYVLISNSYNQRNSH